MTTTDEFMTEMTNALINDAIMHADEIARSIPDPEFAPDPAFEGMCFPEIEQALADFAAEDEWARAEADYYDGFARECY